jgi:hypothetical protein
MHFKTIYEFPSPHLETAWHDCLRRVDCPSHYDAPEYFLEPYWTASRPFAVLALEGDTVFGVLTGLHQGKQITSGMTSRPQICVDSRKDSSVVLEALLQGLLAEARRAELITVYTWVHLPLPAFSARGFRCRQMEGNVVLDLTQGADALFKQFPKDRRRNIRFAEKNGVEVREATTAEDIVEAYDVYRAWRSTQRKAIKGSGRTFEVFDKAARLTASRRVFVARVAGKPAAMNIFRFFPGGLFESAANSSLDEFMHLKPNDLLQWRGIEWACRHGMRRHSLGGSHQFLRRFGGTIVPVLRYRLDRTLLRHHDLKETVRDWGRETVKRMPGPVGERVKGLLGQDS